MEDVAGNVEGKGAHPVGGGGGVQLAVCNFPEFFCSGVRAGDIGRVVLVVMNAHRFLIHQGFKGIVGVRKGG